VKSGSKLGIELNSGKAKVKKSAWRANARKEKIEGHVTCAISPTSLAVRGSRVSS
jgi:hypothetical protein